MYDDPETLYRETAQAIVLLANEAVLERGIFTLALAGGSTPAPLYQLLAGDPAAQIPWDKTLLFWGDERMVPPDHPESNYHMAFETLVRHVPIPEENVYRIPGEYPSAREAAEEYEKQVREVLSTHAQEGLQLALLGIGTDGHTASVFPGDEDTHTDRWIAPAQAPAGASVRNRVTMTLPFLNRSRHVIFLVSGAGKKQPVESIIRRRAGSPYPAARIQPTHQLLVYADRAAAP